MKVARAFVGAASLIELRLLHPQLDFGRNRCYAGYLVPIMKQKPTVPFIAHLAKRVPRERAMISSVIYHLSVREGERDAQMASIEVDLDLEQVGSAAAPRRRPSGAD